MITRTGVRKSYEWEVRDETGALLAPPFVDRSAARILAVRHLIQAKQGIIQAVEISDKLGLSMRTIYRYIRALQDQGEPIGGATGLGYLWRKRG